MWTPSEPALMKSSRCAVKSSRSRATPGCCVSSSLRTAEGDRVQGPLDRPAGRRGRCTHFEEWPFWPPGSAGGWPAARVATVSRRCSSGRSRALAGGRAACLTRLIELMELEQADPVAPGVIVQSAWRRALSEVFVLAEEQHARGSRPGWACGARPQAAPCPLPRAGAAARRSPSRRRRLSAPLQARPSPRPAGCLPGRRPGSAGRGPARPMIGSAKLVPTASQSGPSE